MELDYQIKGWQEVQKALETLPMNIAKRVLKSGVSKAATYAAQQVSLSAPIRQDNAVKRTSKGQVRKPGFLYKNIKAKYSRKYSSTMNVHYLVGGLGQAFYGHFVEGGHKITIKAKSGNVKKNLPTARGGWYMGYPKRGQFVPAHPFIRPAFDRSYKQIEEIMNQSLTDGILKEGEKLGFKKSYGWYFG